MTDMPKFVEEYRTVDKAEWGRGPWQDEPDKAVWVDEKTGLDCLLVRGPVGALCGYVGVPEDHPWHGRDYSASDHICDETCDEGYCSKRHDGSPDSIVNVHGGLTFANECHPDDDPSTGICHLPQSGRPEHIWWFGFDCAHSWDVAPRMQADNRKRYEQAVVEGDTEGMRIWSHSWTDPRESYRDIRYVVRECQLLAGQLASV